MALLTAATVSGHRPEAKSGPPGRVFSNASWACPTRRAVRHFGVAVMPGTARGRHALTRAERFSFEGGPGPGRWPGGRNRESEESDEELRARQMAGINALISISNIDSGLHDRQVEGIRALISIANEVATATASREIIRLPRQGRYVSKAD